jgi:hypothetical protein
VIDDALNFLVNQLDNHLETPSEPNAEMGNILSQDGSTDHLAENSIILTLVNVEEEKVLKSQVPYFKESNGSIFKTNPEIKLNLQILFTANFSNYKMAVKFLSEVISFFQAKNVFDHKNSPTLSQSIEKLILELITPSFEQLNHMWGFLGAKYMPSVIYKVRMLTIQEHKVIESIEKVTGVSKELSSG